MFVYPTRLPIPPSTNYAHEIAFAKKRLLYFFTKRGLGKGIRGFEWIWGRKKALGGNK